MRSSPPPPHRPNRTPTTAPPVIDAMEALVTLLAAMIVAAAGLDVLNLAGLDTRQRVHDPNRRDPQPFPILLKDLRW